MAINISQTSLTTKEVLRQDLFIEKNTPKFRIKSLDNQPFELIWNVNNIDNSIQFNSDFINIPYRLFNADVSSYHADSESYLYDLVMSGDFNISMIIGGNNIGFAEIQSLLFRSFPNSGFIANQEILIRMISTKLDSSNNPTISVNYLNAIFKSLAVLLILEYGIINIEIGVIKSDNTSISIYSQSNILISGKKFLIFKNATVPNDAYIGIYIKITPNPNIENFFKLLIYSSASPAVFGRFSADDPVNYNAITINAGYHSFPANYVTLPTHNDLYKFPIFKDTVVIHSKDTFGSIDPGIVFHTQTAPGSNSGAKMIRLYWKRDASATETPLWFRYFDGTTNKDYKLLSTLDMFATTDSRYLRKDASDSTSSGTTHTFNNIKANKLTLPNSGTDTVELYKDSNGLFINIPGNGSLVTINKSDQYSFVLMNYVPGTYSAVLGLYSKATAANNNFYVIIGNDIGLGNVSEHKLVSHRLLFDNYLYNINGGTSNTNFDPTFFPLSKVVFNNAYTTVIVSSPSNPSYVNPALRRGLNADNIESYIDGLLYVPLYRVSLPGAESNIVYDSQFNVGMQKIAYPFMTINNFNNSVVHFSVDSFSTIGFYEGINFRTLNPDHTLDINGYRNIAGGNIMSQLPYLYGVLTIWNSDSPDGNLDTYHIGHNIAGTSISDRYIITNIPQRLYNTKLFRMLPRRGLTITNSGGVFNIFAPNPGFIHKFNYTLTNNQLLPDGEYGIAMMFKEALATRIAMLSHGSLILADLSLRFTAPYELRSPGSFVDAGFPHGDNPAIVFTPNNNFYTMMPDHTMGPDRTVYGLHDASTIDIVQKLYGFSYPALVNADTNTNLKFRWNNMFDTLFASSCAGDVRARFTVFSNHMRIRAATSPAVDLIINDSREFVEANSLKFLFVTNSGTIGSSGYFDTLYTRFFESHIYFHIHGDDTPSSTRWSNNIIDYDPKRTGFYIMMDRWDDQSGSTITPNAGWFNPSKGFRQNFLFNTINNRIYTAYNKSVSGYKGRLKPIVGNLYWVIVATDFTEAVHDYDLYVGPDFIPISWFAYNKGDTSASINDFIDAAVYYNNSDNKWRLRVRRYANNYETERFIVLFARISAQQIINYLLISAGSGGTYSSQDDDTVRLLFNANNVLVAKFNNFATPISADNISGTNRNLG